MKFSLVFDNTGDSIPFEVIANGELFEFFVNKINAESRNSFSNKRVLADKLNTSVTNLHWAISKTNEVLYSLTGKSFDQHTDLSQYLDQLFLNKTHADWVFSQNNIIDIDLLRHSSNHAVSLLGNQLHNLYPDEIRKVKLAPALEKLGYIFPYERVNMSVHELESSFTEQNLEFSADTKWEVFDNPYYDTMISNNDIVNFSFAYTYVGRQYYNKFEHFDNDLLCKDHYNYETLECSFHMSLRKTQTIPYSKEFLEWAEKTGVRPITTQLPIGNILDLSENLFKYRKVLYRNSLADNRASIIIH